MNLPDKITYLRGARSRVKRAARLLVNEHAARDGQDELLWLVGYESMDLLRAALDAGDDVAALLNTDDVQEARDLAWALYDRLRSRLLAEKLSQVDGRTPEEAAAFLARATELRERAAR